MPLGNLFHCRESIIAGTDADHPAAASLTCSFSATRPSYFYFNKIHFLPAKNANTPKAPSSFCTDGVARALVFSTLLYHSTGKEVL
jgi:hypothetical protein